MNVRVPALAAATTALFAGSLIVAAPAHADDRVCRGTIGAVSIDGDIVVPAGAGCTLKGTRVDGNVKVYGGAGLAAYGVRVGGNIEGEGHRRIGVKPRVVDGRTLRSVIDGNIQAKQGGGGEIRNNVVRGDIQLFSNRNTRFEVRINTVGGNLQCKSNVPAPIGSGNRVEGNKEDQCRNF